MTINVNAMTANSAEPKPRARDLGVPFTGTPGKLNAVSDVAGIEVGHVTLIEGSGPLVVGKGPVRTGVTAIHPRGKKGLEPCYAAWFSLNGNGEMTGTTWITESGLLEGPVMLTNTHSVGVVRDTVVEWLVKRDSSVNWALPVVAETYDGFLNDINGFHVKREHAIAALDKATTGPVAEGNVGGGTGMRVHEFKGGIGTASRVLSQTDGGYTVGVLVQANYGKRDQLVIAGIPVGKEITDLMPQKQEPPRKGGSIIVVIATDAPLLPHQLARLAKRASLGLARTGSIAEHSSGDIFLAFSTANGKAASDRTGVSAAQTLSNEKMNPLFAATVESTEEAIINSMVAAETMTGINGNVTHAIPHDRLREVLRKYNRLK